MATGGTVRSETVTSLIAGMDTLKGKGVDVALTLQIGGYAARNRNEIVSVAQRNGSTHVLFVDNDMVFPPSTFTRLLDHDKDIVGVNYNARGVPGRPIISTVKLEDPENDPNRGKTIMTDFPTQLFKTHAVGTGLMLIKIEVFEKLVRPYFVAFEEPDGTHHTEDVEFCRKAHEVGIDVWCSPSIEVGHIGTYQY